MDKRYQCNKCFKEICFLCIKENFNIETNLRGQVQNMSQNSALFYCAPSILKDINDIKNLKLGLQSKGYENYDGNNLVVSIGILGKASNRSGMKFKMNIEGIVKNMISKSIRMIDPIKIDPEELAGKCKLF